MSVTQVPLQPVARSTKMRLLFGLILLVLGGVALAYAGAGQMRGQTTETGLVIRTLKAGEGPIIAANDGVIIRYKGSLPDGTVFDDGGGQAVPMLVGQVIPGFSEALQRMQKGGRYKIRIPAKLAYGASPPPGSPIPANSDLLFDVDVEQVVPNAAAMAGGQLPGAM